MRRNAPQHRPFSRWQYKNKRGRVQRAVPAPCQRTPLYKHSSNSMPYCRKTRTRTLSAKTEPK
jgi:hypothetical protein